MSALTSVCARWEQGWNALKSETPNADPNGIDTEPVIRERAEHTISRKLIDPHAVKVLYRLHHAGYIAYLVGGGVRDLLLGMQPKDFDVATDASPSQVKRLFRNCFLIGRRFRLAHIRYGDTCIETSTFRKAPQVDAEAEDILIRSDNTFGTPEEDAVRRDFTINGLFYDIGSFQVIDYVGGLDDLDRKLVRAIGDPITRFREDPVRMVRAIRFAARLGFSIEQKTHEALSACAEELSKASPARLYEDILKLYKFGAAEKSFRGLFESGLLPYVFPAVHTWLSKATEEERSKAWAMLRQLDACNQEDQIPETYFLFGVLLYPMLSHVLVEDMPFPKLIRHIRDVAELAAEVLSIPKHGHFIHTMSTLFLLQWQLRHEGKARRLRRMPHEEPFAQALLLYRFHEAVYGVDVASRLATWERIPVLCAKGMSAEEALVEAGLLDSNHVSSRSSGRRRSRRNKSRTNGNASSETPAVSFSDEATTDTEDDTHEAIPHADKEVASSSAMATHAETGEAEGSTGSSRSSSRRRRRRRRKPTIRNEQVVAHDGDAEAFPEQDITHEWPLPDVEASITVAANATEDETISFSASEENSSHDEATAILGEDALASKASSRRPRRRRRRKSSAAQKLAAAHAAEQATGQGDEHVTEQMTEKMEGPIDGGASDIHSPIADAEKSVTTGGLTDASDASSSNLDGQEAVSADASTSGRRPRRRRSRGRRKSSSIIPLASEEEALNTHDATDADGLDADDMASLERDFSPSEYDEDEDRFSPPHWLDEI